MKSLRRDLREALEKLCIDSGFESTAIAIVVSSFVVCWCRQAQTMSRGTRHKVQAAGVGIELEWV